MFNRVATPDPRMSESARANGQPPSIQPLKSGPLPPFAQQPSGPTFAQATSNGQVAMRAPDAPTSVLGSDITIIGQQLVLKTKGSLLIAGQIQVTSDADARFGFKASAFANSSIRLVE